MDPTQTSRRVTVVFAAVVVACLGAPAYLMFTRTTHRYGPSLFLPFAAVVLVLSVVLIVLTIRDQLHGPRRWFLLATGIGAVAIPAILLLVSVLDKIGVMAAIEEGGAVDAILHVIALFVFPFLFVVGAIGTVVSYVVAFLRKRADGERTKT